MELHKEYGCLKNNKVVNHKKLSVDKNYQEVLEDYLDDLHKIIRCSCHSFVTSIDIFNDCVTVNGKSEICLTYQNDKNECFYTDFIKEFEEKIKISDLSDSAFAISSIKDKYCSFRVINQRKIDFHISLSLDVTVYDEMSHPYLLSCDNLKSKIVTRKISNIINSKILKFDFDEEIDVTTSGKIYSIISYNTNIISYEIKSINDKILCKAKAEVTVVYICENGYEKITYNFELSKIIDVSGVDEQTIVIPNFKAGALYIKVKNDCTIQFYGDMFAYLTIIDETEESIITDGYLLNCKSECKYEDVQTTLDCCFKSNDERVSFELDLNEKLTEIKNICIDVLCIRQNKAELCIDVVGKNDDDISCSNYTKEIEIDNSLVSSICIEKFDYNIISDKKLNINLFYKYNSITGENSNCKMLSDIKYVEKTSVNSALTLYFGKNKEKLWDIAKQFSSDVEMIKKDNNLTEDVLNTNKVLIIPGL